MYSQMLRLHPVLKACANPLEIVRCHPGKSDHCNTHKDPTLITPSGLFDFFRSIPSFALAPS